MSTAQSPAFTEICNKAISRGNNVNSGEADIPAMRFCAAAGDASNPDAIDLITAGTVAKMKGVTNHVIAFGKTGDVHEEGIVPVESAGLSTISPGQPISAHLTADSNQGRAIVCTTGLECGGYAETYAPATAGAIVMVRLARFQMP